MSWIFYTVTATILQVFRNLEQKSLNKKLDLLTVCWSRFILPLPIAIVILIYTFPSMSNKFILYCLITGLFQVAGNIFLLQTIKSKNFSIGVAFYKTEVLQALVIGFLFFNQTISFSGLVAIAITVAGVILMSGLDFDDGFKGFLKSLRNKAAFYGLLSGFCFSISAFHIKFASEILLPLGYSNLKAAMTILMWVICFQNVFFIGIKLYQKRFKKDLQSLLSSENKSGFVKTTILSFAGSICWFTAFSLGKVVYVKAVGQSELIIAILVSHFILKEKHDLKEMAGILLTASGLVLLIFLH